MFSVIFFIGGHILLNSYEIIVEWNIIKIKRTQIVVIFIFDYMSITFISLVRIISRSVILFTVSYMAAEKYRSRFIVLVLTFVLSMYLLILSPNIISILLGWDGLGVTSYLLVIFYQRNKSWNAGMLTAITNRIGDVGLLISIATILIYGHWNYLILSYYNKTFRLLLLIIIVVSACTKRAQIPFSAWLPAAMAAPTPVSSLVHSSTLVTAGVYLLLRFNNILKTSEVLSLLFVVSVSTILMAGARAIFEDDMKKIVALSTLSQLGVIIIVLSVHKPILAYYHLILHAYFKAILFMCAGYTIHLIKDYQDIRTIGIGEARMPFIFRMVLVCNISLCGIPFIRGFYSKDIILEYIFIQSNRVFFIFFLIAVATMLTMAYSVRLSLILGFNAPISEPLGPTNYVDLYMFGGVGALYFFSVCGGYIIRWHILISPQIVFMPPWIKILVVFILSIGVIASLILFINKDINILRYPVEFVKNIFFMPYTYSNLNSNLVLFKGKNIWKFTESRWVEYLYFKIIFLKFKNVFNYINFLFINYYIGSILMVFVIFILVWA